MLLRLLSSLTAGIPLCSHPSKSIRFCFDSFLIRSRCALFTIGRETFIVHSGNSFSCFTLIAFFLVAFFKLGSPIPFFSAVLRVRLIFKNVILFLFLYLASYNYFPNFILMICHFGLLSKQHLTVRNALFLKSFNCRKSFIEMRLVLNPRKQAENRYWANLLSKCAKASHFLLFR